MDRRAIHARGQKNKQKEKKTSFQTTYASPSGQIIKSILAILTYPLFKNPCPLPYSSLKYDFIIFSLKFWLIA